GTDPVLGLQATLTATPVEGTHVVELAAVGPRPQLPAALLIALSEVYREQMAREHSSSASQATVLAAEEASRLATAVEQKRREAEAFRVLHNIVSPEREENATLGEMQGLAANLKDAQKLVAVAQGKLEALNAAAADGKGVVRARDDPTLANLEQRASQARENLRQLLQQYTPEYLALDPQTRSLRSRVAELDEQIKAQRKVVLANAMAEAESELASARSSVAQLQKQIADGRQRVGQFAARFSQYRALDTELKDLEKAYQAAQQRKARLDATATARMPAMTVLEQAAQPTDPWRPLYARDAAIVVGGSLLLALAAMALVELFNRSGPTPTVVLTQPTYAPTFTMHRQQALAHASEQPDALTLDTSPRLAAPVSMHAPPLPRELTTHECAALLRAADADTQRALALLLSGVAPHEAIALSWKDLDAASRLLHIGGSDARTMTLAAGALRLFERQGRDDGAPLLPGPSGGSATMESLTAQLVCAAHDAGLENVQDISPAAVRHSYIAFLVRQGARFADLTRWVGRLDAELLAAYSTLTPPGKRLDGSTIRLDFPALEQFESGDL
ncbi:MAG TPA: hypothetical protein VK570_01845, partial [Rubrivivax sp.]|nr:hypothetical protein [Rubrivivax sp.]